MSTEPIIAIIHSFSHDGRGITSIAGKTTFVNGALPGEQVSIKIVKKHRRYNEAELCEILLPAKERTEPPCPHANICGGCSMQHIEMTAQIHFKNQMVHEQLTHFGKVMPQTWLPPILGEPLGYRRKARLGIRYVIKKEKLLVGFREKSSRFLADIENCVVLDPRIGTKLRILAETIQTLSCYQDIPQVEIAASDAVVALIFRHLKPLTENDLACLKQLGQNHQMEIWLQPNAPEVIHKIWPENNHDRLSYFLSDSELKMHFHPLDFTQVNHEINPKMIQSALTLLDLQPTHHILDLFCGLGNFTLPIAKHVEKIIGIEGSQEMVTRATENAEFNHIQNAQFFAANLMDPMLDAHWLKQKYDRILLDPPRSGAKEILPSITQCKAERIVYVSCNPATFARDAGELVHRYHYEFISAGLINMFPHTSHIEMIALFTLKK